MNIVLCGLQSSGKTTIGKALAEKLNKDFLDTDRLIERFYTLSTGNSYSCREIAKIHGETFFRTLEKDVIHSLNPNGSIISTGGGVLMNPYNVHHLQSIGRLFYLKADPKTLWQRILPHGIPSYLDQSKPEESFYQLAMARIPIYEKSAHHTIDTTTPTIEQIVELIIKF